ANAGPGWFTAPAGIAQLVGLWIGALVVGGDAGVADQGSAGAHGGYSADADRHAARKRPRRLAVVVREPVPSNEQAQRRSQAGQDGSEIRSVELERLIARGITTIERSLPVGITRRDQLFLVDRCPASEPRVQRGENGTGIASSASTA